MKIKFSRHAKRQMKWRNISEDDINTVLNDPDKLEDTIKGRKNVFKTVSGRFLKVTCLYEKSEVLVITTIVKGE
jgi:hypothetical protein